MKNIFLIACLIIGLTSCEEVIELELENTTARLVIDAVVDATAQNARVILTKSNGFYESINLDFVEDAIVNLTLADGTIINLPMIQAGIYVTGNLNVTENEELKIMVIDSEGTIYEATENVPHEISIDSLQLIEAENGGPGIGAGSSDITRYQIFTHWKDVADKESFYRIRVTLNDTLQSNLIALSDDVNRNGVAFSQPIFQVFEEGDTVKIELLSIDDGSYRYFNDLDDSGPGFGGTTPFNPKSNFSNNALGYFGIFNKAEQVVIL